MDLILDFERPIVELNRRIDELKTLQESEGLDLSASIEQLDQQVASGEYAQRARDMWSGRTAFPDRDLEVRYDCANTIPAPSISGLNRFRMSASETPPPDLVAVSATVTNNGVVRLPSTTGAGFFTASAINIGAPGTITARVRAPEGIAATITICETDSGGVCLAARSDSTTRAIGTGEIVLYGVFVRATGEIPFNPAATRLILELSDDTGAVRGATSVAVRTP